MGIEAVSDEMGDIAQRAAVEAGAIQSCPVHQHVLIYQGDPDADRRAYAFATVHCKKAGLIDFRTEVMEAVDDALKLSAQDGCPACGPIND